MDKIDLQAIIEKLEEEARLATNYGERVAYLKAIELLKDK